MPRRVALSGFEEKTEVNFLGKPREFLSKGEVK
jgi:hypothetical protein